MNPFDDLEGLVRERDGHIHKHDVTHDYRTWG